MKIALSLFWRRTSDSDIHPPTSPRHVLSSLLGEFIVFFSFFYMLLIFIYRLTYDHHPDHHHHSLTILRTPTVTPVHQRQFSDLIHPLGTSVDGGGAGEVEVEVVVVVPQYGFIPRCYARRRIRSSLDRDVATCHHHQRVFMTRWWFLLTFLPWHWHPPGDLHHQRVFTTRWWFLLSSHCGTGIHQGTTITNESSRLVGGFGFPPVMLPLTTTFLSPSRHVTTFKFNHHLLVTDDVALLPRPRRLTTKVVPSTPTACAFYYIFLFFH